MLLMGSKETGRLRKWMFEYSLLPLYREHECGDCGRFHKVWLDMNGGIRKNYCSKWSKRVCSLEKACSYFEFRGLTQRSKHKDLIALRMVEAAEQARSEPKTTTFCQQYQMWVRINGQTTYVWTGCRVCTCCNGVCRYTFYKDGTRNPLNYD